MNRNFIFELIAGARPFLQFKSWVGKDGLASARSKWVIQNCSNSLLSLEWYIIWSKQTHSQAHSFHSKPIDVLTYFWFIGQQFYLFMLVSLKYKHLILDCVIDINRANSNLNRTPFFCKCKRSDRIPRNIVSFLTQKLKIERNQSRSSLRRNRTYKKTGVRLHYNYC